MHIHILGICGTFMGGIAVLAREAGHRVTGCDANTYPPMSTQLEAQGISLTEGWDPAQTELAPDLFVVGNVVARGNPLMERILDRGLPYVSGPQWLYENVLRSRWVLAVAGTHGKTTTTAMLAWILEQGGLGPGFLVGGVPENFGVSARLPLGDSPFFVIEADEYDTSFFDKRSKFVHYHPRTAVLNNLEFDHADIFPDIVAIETQFHHLVRTIPATGLVVAGAGDSMERTLARGCWTPVERVGTPDGWHEQARGADGFDVCLGGRNYGRVAWDMVGEHSRLNALAALAAGRHAGVPVELGIAALNSFVSVKRRLEVRGTVAGVTVYDDFAHHPSAIRTTVAGLRERVGAARILAVLEPRSNTMKMGVLKDELAPSLGDAQRVFCYTAGIGWDAPAALRPLGARLTCDDDLERLAAAVASEARPGDQVLVMSNGGFGGIHQRLLNLLSQRAVT